MRIGVIGAGNVGSALAAVWARAGHEIVVGSRTHDRAKEVAERVGGTAVPVREVGAAGDAVLLAVPWASVDEALAAAGAAEGVFAGKPLIDPTNAVNHGKGEVLVESAAAHVAGIATGAHVVKAFNLLPAAAWGTTAPVVPVCGDDPAAVSTVLGLVGDVGATGVHLGGLDRARQVEQVAGFVIGLIFQGIDPTRALPRE
ncbi:NAD(P)-binding domain-containing protein [Actinokineospora auranticolor]|uniref:Pyrroline-5-carboxylate reductase catalytic N-terminal domain-containing protein n=1 Tax=Actinokineospora auranticolor TaxID=155976 RepID=A0A2S6GM98_9PSEU|nr:NAD(P)-binding domain-containing protein [Actinokineospora auranticolor]PPK66358.1 hypothetical protein CLV40_11062 [Actinokineospora auranticolor]